MSLYSVAVKLKIPDNEAYTALTALRRLGVNVARLERAVVWQFEDAADPVARIERSETLYNPNKHELEVLEQNGPRAGEAWIEELGAREERSMRRYIAWRLFADAHAPADDATVRAAVERLLCNPAIERAKI